MHIDERLKLLKKDKKIDMALIESPVFKDGIIYREWIEDEIVIFSKLNKDVRGIPMDILKSMAKWIKTNEKIKKLRESFFK